MGSVGTILPSAELHFKACVHVCYYTSRLQYFNCNRYYCTLIHNCTVTSHLPAERPETVLFETVDLVRSSYNVVHTTYALGILVNFSVEDLLKRQAACVERHLLELVQYSYAGVLT